MYKDTAPLLDEKAKRTLLRNIPHPLNICGVKEGDDVNGFTLSWMTQASFKPPLIVIGVRQDSRSHAMIKASQVFAVSFLEVSQQDLAETFLSLNKESAINLVMWSFTWVKKLVARLLPVP